MAEIENPSPHPELAGSFGSTHETVLRNFFCLVTLALVLIALTMPVHAAEFDPNLAASDGSLELFVPGGSKRSALVSRTEAGRQSVQFNRKLARLPLRSEVRLSLPLGVSYVLIFDNRLDHSSGNVTWVGSLKGYGDDYRAVITFGEGGVSGRIVTPDGEFLVESDAHGEWLIDPQAAGLVPEGPGLDDALIPSPEEVHRQLLPSNPGVSDPDVGQVSSGDSSVKDNAFTPFGGSNQRGDQAVAALDTAPVTIDVMILYTPALANRLGSGLSARFDQLVALSNQAYRDSGVYIDLRLVHTQQVNYSDTTSNSAALNALTGGGDPTLADVASLRNTYGADLVTLVRPFNQSTAGGCGVAWVGGYGGQPISSQASYGYSVVSDGSDINGSGYYCLDLTFAHELGHNMGSMHDRANAGGGSGAYPYSYGYGINGTFGTVMSYISPRIGKFSNPGIVCAGGITCGISETAPNSANNALSLNNTRMAVADFRPAQQTPPSPSTSYILTVSKSGVGTVSSNPAGINCGGDCNEPYDSGTVVTLSATPASGYTFGGWSGACAGTGACAVTMSAARSVTATFTALLKYTLTVSKSGSGAVVSDVAGINCGGDCNEPYDSGTVVTLVATPADGYIFSGWSGACSGTAGICTVTMSAARNVTATFKAIPKYYLTVGRSGSGTVTSDVAGINCGSDCSEPYLSGTAVNLTATAATGYYFSGWSGACAGAGACAVTMSAARSVTATFKANPVLTVSRSGSGAVTSDVAGINCGTDCSEPYLNGTVVTLTATPASGHTFGGWSGACTGTADCTVTMTAARSVTARFAAIPKYYLTVGRSGSGTVSGPGINCGSDCRELYVTGTVVTLTATPADGYVFSGWSGACAGTADCTVTMTAARSVTARFAAIPKYYLTVGRSGSGTVSGPGINCGSDCRELYVTGTVVTLTATPADGYVFGGWSGACAGTADCTVTMTAARSVTARFAAIPKYYLTVGRSGSGTVVSDVAGINCGSDCYEPYLSGTVVSLTATPATGYIFSGWSGACAGTGVCTVTMTATRSVTATFRR